MAKKFDDGSLASTPVDATVELDVLSDILTDDSDSFDFDSSSAADSTEREGGEHSSERSETDYDGEAGELRTDADEAVSDIDEASSESDRSEITADSSFEISTAPSAEASVGYTADGTADISADTALVSKAAIKRAEKSSDTDSDRGGKLSDHKVTTPSEYKGGRDDGGEFIRGGHGDETLTGKGGDDFIKAGKGADIVVGNEGDDVLDGGHGNDKLEGGAGNDILNGDKGNDVLVYNLGDNIGATDYYDGGKGADTLVIRVTTEEFARYEDELNDLIEWVAENSDERRSSSKQFNDGSMNSPAHPVYESSFGLNIRHMEDVQIEIVDAVESPIEPAVVEEPVVEAPVAEVVAEPAESEMTGTVTGDGPIPLKNIDVSLATGSQITFDIEVSVEALPAKYDVFMLHDLSGSFWNDLPNVQAQFSGLYDSLTASGDVAFGVGSFVDKPMETFGAGYDYVYNTDHAVSTDKEAIQSSLDSLVTKSGWDWPEAQMEALVQTALRADEIGFRDGAQKFAVLFTDAPYHKEGDFAYAAEGSNDYDTELEAEDYPDPAVVGKMLIEAGITPVFAVTAAYMATYQELVDDWGVGIVTELTSDSSNIADAIINGLTEAPINLELDTIGDDYGFVSSVEPPIYEDVEPGTYTFTVTLEIPEDSTGYSSDSMTFEITGYGEVNVNVTIEKVDITGDSTNDTLTGDAGPNGIYGLRRRHAGGNRW